MYGNGGYTSSSTSMMFPYDVPVPQPYPYPMPVTQTYFQHTTQFVDMPVPHTIQPVIVPSPVAVPFPQPVAVPIDRPCAVPFPVGVPIPQPYAVPQPVFIREQVGVPVPVPVPVAVPVAQQPQYRQVEYITEEPVYIKRYRRRRCRRRCRSLTPPPAPLPPIIIPIPIQAPAAAPPAQPAYQITEYVQDIYPPAQVFTEQVPVGYVVRTLSREEAAQGQIQPSININGTGGVQRMIVPQSGFSPSNSTGLFRSSPHVRQFQS